MDIVEPLDILLNTESKTSSTEQAAENPSQVMPHEVKPDDSVSSSDSSGVFENMEGMFRKGHSSESVPCLVAIDGHFLPGYHPETVKRLGSGGFAGLWSEMKLIVGDHTKGFVMLIIGVSDDDRDYKLSRVVVPIKKIQPTSGEDDLEATRSDDSIMGVLNSYSPFPTNLKHGATAARDPWTQALLQPGPAEPEGFVVERFPGTFIQRITRQVRSWRVDINVADLKVHLCPGFDRLSGCFNEELYDFQAAIYDALGEMTRITSFQICFRPDNSFNASDS